MITKKNNGFSLIELMIVVAGIAGLAVVGMQINKTQNVFQVKSALDSDMLLTTNEINAILSDPIKCMNTLGGKNALSTTTGINAINSNKYLSLDGGASANKGYGNSNVQIKNYSLSATNSDLSSNNSFLIVNFVNKNTLKGTTTNSTIAKKINLYVETDSNNKITKCRSLSTSTTDLWTRGTATDSNNIYYNGGVRAGDETQTTICNAFTEGTLRYNKSNHSIEFCTYKSGLPPTYSWQSGTAMGGAITCKKRIYFAFSGPGPYTFNFNAADCGGILPDNRYTGAIKVANACNGLVNVWVNDSNEGGPSVGGHFSNPCVWPDGSEALFHVVFVLK